MSIHVLVTDLMMPRMDGFELLKRLGAGRPLEMNIALGSVPPRRRRDKVAPGKRQNVPLGTVYSKGFNNFYCGIAPAIRVQEPFVND